MPLNLTNDEATRNSTDGDGFFYAGDIGHVDVDGNYCIVDRVKEHGPWHR